MDDKYIQFGKDLEKLILDFNNSRKKYHKRYIAIKLLAIFFSTASTITISLSFVEECQVLFKIISVILSGISTILISFDKVTDYKSRWQQRTITFVKLQEIKQSSLAVDHIHMAQQLAGLHLVARLDVHASELAVEREIVAVLDKDAFVVAGHYHDLAYFAVEHRLDRGPFLEGDSHAVVERKFEIGIDRVVVLAEMVHYGTLSRPRELALVGFELLGKGIIDRFA